MGRQQGVAAMRWFAAGIAAIGLILAVASTSSGGELGKLTLQDEPLELLGGRVLVMMPEGAKVEPRKATNIMGPDPSADEEGRIVLDAGGERLVLMARETFQWADKDLREVLGKRYADCSITPLPEGEKAPKSYLLVPKEAPPIQTATLVASGCLILPDKTVILLQAYGNKEACQDLPGCTALAKQILTRAGGGSVALKHEAGTKRIRLLGAKKDLEIALPADQVLTTHRGPDFMVHYIRPLSPYGSVPGTLVLYQGAHPSSFLKQDNAGAKPPEAQSADGTFVGQKASWKKWTINAGDQVRTCAETIVPCGDMWNLHLYFSAQKPEEMAACEKIAQGMALVDKPPAAAAAETTAPNK